MSLTLYNLGILLYSIAISVFSLFNPKAKKFKQGRENWRATLSSKISKNKPYTVWFHTASLGEFEQARPVIEAFKIENPNTFIFLTFFSPSGYEIQKGYENADLVAYLPIDTSQNAQDFIEIIKPDLAVFVKYEFWYHYLNQLNNRQIPIIYFSVIFRESQPFFKPWGGLFREMLTNIDVIYVQDQHSKMLAEKLKLKSVHIAGDTRFDRVIEICEQAKKIDVVEAFARGDELILVAGSTWEDDEDYIFRALLEHIDIGKVKLIIAPHEIHEAHIKEIEKLFVNRTVRFSHWNATNQKPILIIDNMGMLSSVYRYGDVAYIGGGFGDGLHNILEALVYGLPVVFGPKYKKFKEAVDIIEKGGGFTFSNLERLKFIIQNVFLNATERAQASDICKHYVQENKGASTIVVKKLIEYAKQG